MFNMQIHVPSHSLEAELIIKPAMQGYFTPRILRANGAIETPFDKPVKNLIIPQYLNHLLSFPFSGSNTSFSMLGVITGACHVGLSDDIGFRVPDVTNPNNSINFEGGSLFKPVLRTIIKAGNGNSADVDADTGNCVLTSNWQFAAATAVLIIREACITGGGFPAWGGGNAVVNRAVLPSPITLQIGDVLQMSYSLIIPTLCITPQTVTLAAQGGMDISGQLKLIGLPASVVGGTITAAGSVASVNSGTTAGGVQGGAIFPGNSRGGLTTATTFPTQLTNTTGMNTNQSSLQAWNAYSTGANFRDYVTTWNAAFATTSFRSISLYLANGIFGYQLLLDNQQTKESGKTLSVAWRFAL